MKRRLPFYLSLAGTALLLGGVAAVRALSVHYESCNGDLPNVVCQGYVNTLHWTYPVIALGALCFIAAGLFSSKLLRRNR
jgi:hypothetical protein